MIRIARLSSIAALALLGACTASKPVAPVTVSARPPALAPQGLERVLGRDARALQLLFGQPNMDTREDRARRLQFAGAACVLDAYLYPQAAGREPVVTYLDARTPNGDDFDRASCIAALSRRSDAR
ncbi:hypothetical protein ABC347_09910 [Sphingomonas sp. 1P06PA]|uniref:hypothetical protein n=1 Tax=Sphingomonas sp. 1P06PA TaxID=554121 RepID=UPI0039A5B659